ncbi:MAG TPA: hypothetical protein VFI00_19965 [Kribbella sp.]|nr:hypothetical protein [Kribbella sp.]
MSQPHKIREHSPRATQARRPANPGRLRLTGGMRGTQKPVGARRRDGEQFGDYTRLSVERH